MCAEKKASATYQSKVKEGKISAIAGLYCFKCSPNREGRAGIDKVERGCGGYYTSVESGGVL